MNVLVMKLKTGAVLNRRPKIEPTPMPPPIVHHSATIHRIGVRQAEEPDPSLLVLMLWPIAFVAIVVLACCLWPFGESA